MAKMAVAMTGTNLSSDHSVAGVSILDHIFRLERPGEARPSRVAVKLVNRSKQRLARHDIHVNTRLFVVPIGVIKQRFCPVTLRHLVLLGRKMRYGFRILVILRHMLTCALRPRLDAYKEMTSTKNSERTRSHYHYSNSITVRQ